MAHFKQTTTGKAVIMGRKTFDSLGRALPGRENVVLSRDPHFRAPDCIVVTSVDEAIEHTRHFDEAIVIGGSVIYEAFLPRAERLYLTRIDADVCGDVCFPDFDPCEWREIARRDVAADDRHAHAFSMVTLERCRRSA
jgi:dihydrofolate reductase